MKRKCRRVLVIDVGGTHVKLLVSGKRAHREFESGPGMTPPQMVAGVKELTRDWASDVVAIGFPGPVRRGRPAREPWHLGPGWTRFDFRRAFGKPVRLVNDAAMQALGSYGGGRMLFLGLGTGLGSALVNRGVLEPLELAHLPYRNGRTFDDDLGQLGLERLGKRRWRKAVEEVVGMLRDALQADYVVLGGGNVRHVKRLPGSTRRGSNANAFRGGFLLWKDA
jgi:polyphosphate glucokinase